MRYLTFALLLFIECSNPVTQEQTPIGKGRFFALVETEILKVETIEGDTARELLNCGGSAVVFNGTTVAMVPRPNDSNILRYDTLPESLMALQLGSTHYEGRIEGSCLWYNAINSIPCALYLFQDTLNATDGDSIYITGYDGNTLTMKHLSQETRLAVSDSLVITSTTFDTIQFVEKRIIDRNTITHIFKLGAVLDKSMVKYLE